MGLKALMTILREFPNMTKIKLCRSCINMAKEGIPNVACGNLWWLVPTLTQYITFQVGPTCQGLGSFDTMVPLKSPKKM